MKKYTYKIEGMHCASCELLIEEKLIQLPEIEAVDASSQRGEVIIYYNNERPTEAEIHEQLKDDGYSCRCEGREVPVVENPGNTLTSVIIAGLVFVIFLLLNGLGFSSLVNVSASSSLPAFFLFGLLAGVSTCAALTGGIVLSMSSAWQQGYAKNDSVTEKMKPHLIFNAGRIVSYVVLGGILGIVGSRLQLSPTLNALLVIFVSIFMILNGLKMFGVKALRGFNIALPKSITHKTSNQQNFQGKYMPAAMGALTILLPCGFTITAESLALLSKDPIQGTLIMAMFALGTAPGLLAIGYSSVKMSNSSQAAIFSRVAGALVLMFAIFNINNQLNVLNLPNLNFLSANSGVSAQGTVFTQGASNIEGLAPLVNGKQLLRMEASSYGYSPNTFKVRAGVPVRWEITDTGTSGCTNAIISRNLFADQIDLTPGQVSVKEFTPTKAGKYRFSCWMGMVSGVIEVVDSSSGVTPSINNAAIAAEIPSGAKGCGCGGGGGASCGTSNVPAAFDRGGGR